MLFPGNRSTKSPPKQRTHRYYVQTKSKFPASNSLPSLRPLTSNPRSFRPSEMQQGPTRNTNNCSEPSPVTLRWTNTCHRTTNFCDTRAVCTFQINRTLDFTFSNRITIRRSLDTGDTPRHWKSSLGIGIGHTWNKRCGTTSTAATNANETNLDGTNALASFNLWKRHMPHGLPFPWTSLPSSRNPRGTHRSG